VRSGAAEGTTGFFHEAALYGSDEELLDVAGPFLQGGLDAGEPTVCAFADHNARLVRDAFGPDCGLLFLPGADHYAQPATAIRGYQELFGRLAGEGAEQIRVVGDVPQPGTGGTWRDWARYEVVVNTAYEPLPIWGLCPYDTRTTPDMVLDDVLASHPRLSTADGRHLHNERFDPQRVLERLPEVGPDPLQTRTPDVVLLDPAPVDARRATLAVATEVGLTKSDLDTLLLVVTELVTNAIRHGDAPVVLELWTEPGRVVVAVTDRGSGPADPCAGLVRTEQPEGGLGLWLAHQVCADVALHRHDHGFTARAAVGRSPQRV
jgi:anti-sigma regulatory factor (Ser/Thr protein kinase)